MDEWKLDCLFIAFLLPIFKVEFSFPSVHVSWADACIVVYSIGNQISFEAASSMLEEIQRLKSPFYLPILLLGNQKDLEHLRQVQ